MSSMYRLLYTIHSEFSYILDKSRFVEGVKYVIFKAFEELL